MNDRLGKILYFIIPNPFGLQRLNKIRCLFTVNESRLYSQAGFICVVAFWETVINDHLHERKAIKSSSNYERSINMVKGSAAVAQYQRNVNGSGPTRLLKKENRPFYLSPLKRWRSKSTTWSVLVPRRLSRLIVFWFNDTQKTSDYAYYCAGQHFSSDK